ncbi:MAG: hypothetical protein FD170_191 [Bacteroidetes bacterium]|nr:MAG: hypothetical protein FD170_191 [Bacteroidota bacterium]
MRLYKFIINGLFALSLILIIWINFFENYFIKTALLIDAEKVNSLIETISIAYLTSFIFYVVVVVLKTKRDEKIILPFIADYTFVALNNCMFFCFSMRSAAGLKFIKTETSIYKRNLNIYPNENDLNEICSTINPNKPINKDVGLEGFTSIPHFFGVMINYSHRIDYFLKIILEKSRFMDIELLRILTDIQTHGYHQHMISYDKSLVLTAKHRHDDLKVFKDSLKSYFDLYLKLENYANKKLKRYVERKSLKQ